MTDIHNEFGESRLFCEARIERRAVDELVGVAAGISADGMVNEDEARFLRQWIDDNTLHLDDPVVNLLYRRLNDMLADNALDKDESQDLLSLLRSFNRNTSSAASDKSVKLSSDLPFDDPQPDIEFEGKIFLFTGTMIFGPRSECESIVCERGGSIGKGVSKKIDYLIVGTIANEQWKHSSYGTKISKAMMLREKFGRLSIVSEESWQKSAFGGKS